MRAVLVFLQPELTGMRVDAFGDNEGAKAIANNPSSASRSEHIDVKFHFIRGLVRGGSSCLARGNGGSTCRCANETLVEK